MVKFISNRQKVLIDPIHSQFVMGVTLLLATLNRFGGYCPTFRNILATLTGRDLQVTRWRG